MKHLFLLYTDNKFIICNTKVLYKHMSHISQYIYFSKKLRF